MPFDVFVTRAKRLDLPSTGPTLTLAELGPPPNASPMVGGGYRVAHPGGGPWLVARDHRNGIHLSTSYSNTRFLRNFADMFDLALSLGGAVGANVIEEVRGDIVTSATVNPLLDPRGPYVTLQANTFRLTRQRIEEEGMAPLEYPVGPIDLVREYLSFEVQDATPDGVDARLRAMFKDRVTRVSPTTFLVTSLDDRGWLARTFGRSRESTTKVLVREDGRAQIWPSWRGPFQECGPVTLEVALALADSLGSPAMLGDTLCDEAFVDSLRPHLDGLGVDFYGWRGGADPTSNQSFTR